MNLSRFMNLLMLMNLSNRDLGSLNHYKDSFRFMNINQIYPTLVKSSMILGLEQNVVAFLSNCITKIMRC